MRVTDRMLFEQASTGVAKARERHLDATAELSSGRRVEHPWDDPASAGLLVKHRLDVERLEATQAAVGRASDELATVDGALGDMANLVTRARELAIQLANETYSPLERQGAAAEVSHLFQAAVALMNTQAGGRYIFGGYKDGAAPFDAAGNYLGDAGVRQVEIAPGVLQDVSVRADVAVKGVGGGVDVLSTLSALATALGANDLNGIRASIGDLDAGTGQLSLARAQGGAAMNVLDGALLAARAGKDAALASIAGEADVDVADAASRLALAERALDASLTASARSFRLTLLDKL